MKKIAVILALFSVTCLSAQNKNSKLEIDKIEKNLEELNESFSRINLKLEKAEKTRDSLERELIYYRAKEDYFAEALEDQSNRFALIVTGILAVWFLISFSSFKLEVNRIKGSAKRLHNKQISEFENFNDRVDKIEANVLSTAANYYSTLTSDYHNKDKKLQALKTCLLAIVIHVRTAVLVDAIQERNGENKREDYYKNAITHLNFAMMIIGEMEKNHVYKPTVKEYYEMYISESNKINNLTNEEVINLMARLRTNMLDFIK